MRFFATTIFFVTFLSSTENPFNLQENREKIEQEKKAYLERFHLKSDVNIFTQIQDNETNDTNRTLSEREVIWKKIREDSNSTQKITVF